MSKKYTRCNPVKKRKTINRLLNKKFKCGHWKPLGEYLENISNDTNDFSYENNNVFFIKRNEEIEELKKEGVEESESQIDKFIGRLKKNTVQCKYLDSVLRMGTSYFDNYTVYKIQISDKSGLSDIVVVAKKEFYDQFKVCCELPGPESEPEPEPESESESEQKIQPMIEAKNYYRNGGGKSKKNRRRKRRTKKIIKKKRRKTNKRR